MLENKEHAYNALWWLHKKADFKPSNENTMPDECHRQYYDGEFVPKEYEFEFYDLEAMPFSQSDEEILYICNQGYKWRSGFDSLIEEIKKLNPQKLVMINDDCHTRLVGLQQGGDEWITNESTIFQDIVDRTGIENYLVLECEYGAQRYYLGSCIDEEKILYYDHFTQSWEWKHIEQLYRLKTVKGASHGHRIYEEVPYENIKYKICCVNKRPELHRHLAAMHLAGNKDVFLTNYSKWQLKDIILGDYDREWCRNNKDLMWNKMSRMYQRKLETRRAILEEVDTTWDAKNYRDIGSERQILTTQKHAESFVSLIPETLWHKDTQFWSEKTKKAIITKRPFLLLAPAGTLRLLKDLGFKTFDRFWDESYDDIKDQGKRYEAVMKIVDQILALPMEECTLMLLEMHQVLKHNYYHALEITGKTLPQPVIPQEEKERIIEQRNKLNELLKSRAFKKVDRRMNIAIFGDSWTQGYGVPSPWSDFLPDNFMKTNLASSGSDNIKILNSIKQYLELNVPVEYMIVAWSSIARKIYAYGDVGLHTYPTDFEHKELADRDQLQHFEENSIEDLFENWKQQIQEVEKLAAEKNIKVMHYSVFGEKPNWECTNFYGSFIEMLAPEPFKYELPMFEYDMSNNANPMKPKYKEMFGDNWEYAVTERELLRETPLFQGCGHPNGDGHVKLSKIIQEHLYDKT